MSAFDRLPQDYREECAAMAAQLPPKNALEIMQVMQRHARGQRVTIPQAKRLSVQNRRVRLAVDLQRAYAKGHIAIRETRQMRRHYQRRIAVPAPSAPVGPDEV